MAKKKKKPLSHSVRVDVILKGLRLKDLQRECVLRGMEFKKVAECSILRLHSWLIQNWDNPIRREAIDEYDRWLDTELSELGRDDLIHPSLNLGSTENETGQIVKKRIRQVNPQKKKKKSRTVDGIFTGTKKAYTYELAKQGIEKSEAIKMVIEKFPEAKEKSISIWFNKARKLV